MAQRRRSQRVRQQQQQYTPGDVVDYSPGCKWQCHCDSGPELNWQSPGHEVVACGFCKISYGHITCYGLSALREEGGESWSKYLHSCMSCNGSKPTASIPITRGTVINNNDDNNNNKNNNNDTNDVDIDIGDAQEEEEKEEEKEEILSEEITATFAASTDPTEPETDIATDTSSPPGDRTIIPMVLRMYNTNGCGEV